MSILWLGALSYVLVPQRSRESAGTDLAELAGRKPDLAFYETTHAEPFSTPELCLRPGLMNFQPVKAGDTLHAVGSPEITAPNAGAILFPKYPQREGSAAIAPWPNEIYRLVSPLTDHPVRLWEDE